MMLGRDFSMSFKLLVCAGENSEPVDTVTVDIGPDGIDLRNEDQCKLEAGNTVSIALEKDHCHQCRHWAEQLHEAIGLTDAELTALTRWRTRKQDGISSKMLGEILDKVVKALNTNPAPDCDDDIDTIVLKVES